MGKVLGHKYSIKDYFEQFTRQLNNRDYLSARISLERMMDCEEKVNISNLLADFCLETGDYNESILLWGHVLENPEELIGHVYNSLAACYYFRGDYHAASNYFSKQVEVDENQEYRFDYLARLVAEKINVDEIGPDDYLPPDDEDLTEEEIDYIFGLELNTSYAKKYIDVARFNYSNGDKDRAFKMIKKALKEEEITDVQKLDIIYLLYIMGKQSQIKLFKLDEFYHSLNKDNYDVLLYLKASIAILGDNELASLCRENLKNNNAHYPSYLILGQVLFNMGKKDEAKDAFKKASLCSYCVLSQYFYNEGINREDKFFVDLDVPSDKRAEYEDAINFILEDDADIEDSIEGFMQVYGTICEAFSYAIRRENDPLQEKAIMALGCFTQYDFTLELLRDGLCSPSVLDVNKYAIFRLLLIEQKFQKEKVIVLRNYEFFEQYLYKYKGSKILESDLFIEIFDDVQSKLFVSFELTKRVKKVFNYIYNFVKEKKISIKNKEEAFGAFVYSLCTKEKPHIEELSELFDVTKQEFNLVKKMFADKGFDKKNIK